MNAKRFTAIVGITITALALAGCGSGVEKDATYESVLDLREAIVSEDIFECEETNIAYDSGGLESIACGPHAVIATWPKESFASGMVEEAAEDRNLSYLRGPNWTVLSTDVAVLSMAKDKLGGTMTVDFDPTS